MEIFIFFVIHWYSSLFFQSVFHHRYAAHGQFVMSKSIEKVFYIGCFITQGSSYISAAAYGMMHRMHHAHTDTDVDPHSPKNSANVFSLMWQTRNSYFDIYKEKTAVEEKFKKDLPVWKSFDRIAHNWITRILWIISYTAFYVVFATHWWVFLFLPLTIIMGSLQGAAVNWWAHRFGYVNFSMNNTSKNILPVDLIFLGEAFHNNHHHQPGRANNSVRWFEFDPGYQLMVLLHRLKIIRLVNYS